MSKKIWFVQSVDLVFRQIDGFGFSSFYRVFNLNLWHLDSSRRGLIGYFPFQGGNPEWHAFKHIYFVSEALASFSDLVSLEDSFRQGPQQLGP